MYELGVAVWWDGELHYSNRKTVSSLKVDELYKKLVQVFEGIEADEIWIEPGTRCGMHGCERKAIKMIEISEHPDLMAAMDLPEKIVRLPCCLEHTLEWEIGWLFGDYGIGVTPRLLGEFVFRALAEAGERMRDAMI